MVTVKYEDYIAKVNSFGVCIYRYDKTGTYDFVARIRQHCFYDEDVIKVILAIDSLEVGKE